DAAAVFLADGQGGGMLAHKSVQIRERVGGPGDSLGALPQLEHLRALLQTALADRQRHARTNSRASSSIAAVSSMSSVCSMTRVTPSFSQARSSSTSSPGAPDRKPAARHA